MTKKHPNHDPYWTDIQLQNKTIAVIGSGWSALTSLAKLSGISGIELVWIEGSGEFISSPLGTVAAGTGVEFLEKLAFSLGIDLSEREEGNFQREFRNKAFSLPPWSVAQGGEEADEIRRETLWGGERQYVSVIENHFGLPLAEIEKQIRERVAERVSRKISVLPIEDIRRVESRIGVVLGSGETLEFDQVIFADRWYDCASFSGLSKKPESNVTGEKPAPWSQVRRKWDSQGAVQIVFQHSKPIGVEMNQSFIGVPHKNAGEQLERRMFGFFFPDGMSSQWTFFLTQDEIEDNQSIGRRIRKLRQTLNRMFAGSEWLPEGVKEFTDLIEDEQVRLIEHVVFGAAKLEPPKGVYTDLTSEDSGLVFVTDGFGVIESINQIQRIFEEPGTKQSDSVDSVSDSSQSAEDQSISI